jgi:hypothetical protein
MGEADDAGKVRVLGSAEMKANMQEADVISASKSNWAP